MEKAIIFGAGRNFEKYEKRIEELYDIIAVVDNSTEKQNSGERIQRPDYILTIEFDKIIITPNESVHIYNQCIKLGVPQHKIIVLMREDLSEFSFIIGYKTYAQHYEDLILAAIFGQIGVYKPSYIDLGANHPCRISNTAMFYENGCRGINIEANPLCIESFNKLRPEDVNLNIGVADQDGLLTFYKAGDTNGLNTFSVEETQRWDTPPQETVKIKVTKLSNIISEYCPNGFPDLLDCDIEGYDYAVLSNYDFTNSGPKVICVEVRTQEIEEFDKMMKTKGYFKFCRIGENNIYVRNEYSSVLCHLDSPL